MKTKIGKIQGTLQFPTYFEYQIQRLFPVAKVLVIAGVLYILGFLVFDYYKFPDQRKFILFMRVLVITPLLLNYVLYTWWGKERYFSLAVMSLTITSMLLFFYLNLMVLEKNNLLPLINVYYLLAAVALSPLITKHHFTLGVLLVVIVQTALVLNQMPVNLTTMTILPHLIGLSVFTTVISFKLMDSAKEHYLIAKNSHEMQFMDEMTQVFNRKGIFTKTKEMLENKNDGQVISLLMIDLDFFKSINDNFGHAVGDLAITQTADCIQQTLDQTATMGRLGGEEFLVVASGKAPDHNEQLADRLLLKIKQQLFKLNNDDSFSITASIGVVHHHQQSFGDLLKAADNMMYQAKKKGRDCVVIEKIGEKFV